MQNYRFEIAARRRRQLALIFALALHTALLAWLGFLSAEAWRKAQEAVATEQTDTQSPQPIEANVVRP